MKLNKKIFKLWKSFETRFVKEHDELLKRLAALERVVDCEDLNSRKDISSEEKELLKQQRDYMENYFFILHQRMGMHELFKTA